MNAYRWTMEWARAQGVRTLGRLECGSTNAEAKTHLEMLGHRSLVVADHQTAGRGRGDHAWSDITGHALLSSWIFHTTKSPQPIMSALIGLALYESALKTWPKVAWALKAPNDLHVIENVDGKPSRAKKIAGILIELLPLPGPSKGTAVIVGLGFNVSDAPTGTTPYAATCLGAELGPLGISVSEADWTRFLKNWMEACEARTLEGQTPNLKQPAQDALAAALARHPDYREIQTVEADGSLIFSGGRKVAWSSL